MADKYFVIVPAAGCGKRMQMDKAKQYIEIAGKTIIEHALAPFLLHPKIEKVVVVLAKADKQWYQLSISVNNKIITTEGGQSRCDSVFNGLMALKNDASEQDWILIHDAARPLIQQKDINKLMVELAEHDIGGLLGSPIHSTIKQVDEQQQVLKTIPRERLWCALTPQMYRYRVLKEALSAVLPDSPTSDSTKAIEQLGYFPKMIEGCVDNIKVTTISDLDWAEKLLHIRGY